MQVFKIVPELEVAVPAIQQQVQRELQVRGYGNVVIGTIGFLVTPLKIINEILQPLRFPPAITAILFSRPAGIEQPIHVDCTADDDLTLVNAALNIPLANADSSAMNWYTGEYTIIGKEAVGRDGIKRKYAQVNWNDAPSILDRTYMQAPTLVRVSIPHNVSRSERHREILTVRFAGNPTFDELCAI